MLTHTYAILEVSPSTYDEIAAKLKAADYHHAFSTDGDDPIVDMHGIALKSSDKETRKITGDDRLRVLLDERNAAVLELIALKAKEPPLLICIDCKNTESCAGAMARQFNHGRCVHCGGYFKVVRA